MIGRISTKRWFCSQMGVVRTRFAPSPTGGLHIGGLRTALYNYLFARQNDGRMIIRIEDTDQKRVVNDAVSDIEDALKWVGICSDEGPNVGGPYSPYYQSQRLDLYRNAAERLLTSGHAYRCFCSEERLSVLSMNALRAQKGYDNRCRHLTSSQIQEYVNSGSSFTVRLKLNYEPVLLDDLVFGQVNFSTSFEGDPIVLKSDKFPTYHLANVVDDYEMKISHVLRGEEWLVSTKKHLQIYDALDYKPPRFAHLPLLLDLSGLKLSKRRGSVFVADFKSKGYYPESLLNFLCSYGGGFDDFDPENGTPCSLEDLVQKFDLNQLFTHHAQINMDRLDRINRNILATKDRECIKNDLIYHDPNKLHATKLSDESFDRLLLYALQDDRVSTVNEILEKFDFVWNAPELNMEDLERTSLKLKKSEALVAQCALTSAISLSRDGQNDLVTVLKNDSQSGMKYGKLMKYLRWLLTGGTSGLPIAQLIEILGLDECVRRCESFQVL